MRWEDYAACFGNPEPFMEDYDTEALDICWNRCRVRVQCLQSALIEEKDNIDPAYFGSIRGGYTPHERWIMIKHDLMPKQV